MQTASDESELSKPLTLPISYRHKSMQALTAFLTTDIDLLNVSLAETSDNVRYVTAAICSQALLFSSRQSPVARNSNRRIDSGAVAKHIHSFVAERIDPGAIFAVACGP